MAKTKASGSLGDRCKCGWAVGANTSGDCVLCNDAIAKLPRRRMRPEATEQRLDDDDAFEQDKVSLKPPIKSQKTNTLSKAAQQQAADLRLKQDADLLLQGNGFARATVVENGSQHAGLVAERCFALHVQFFVLNVRSKLRNDCFGIEHVFAHIMFGFLYRFFEMIKSCQNNYLNVLFIFCSRTLILLFCTPF
jgi:hypothetical protein